MKKISKKIADSEKEYNANLSQLFNEILPTYEKKCLTEYLQGEIITNDSYILSKENDGHVEEFKKTLVFISFFIEILLSKIICYLAR